eukprot:NODE_15335_length_221_cov_9.941860_g14422_i0.p2 GENE.NODE_15335_length_221_cov_9.941860_g14422_i0~~NODE_15335_length_221_cov_9.941860_g14422_i0.p2  ORF type:complete len:56 (+),score=26.55 NODE_15335_length_221_cov_9.941860_g14422_i0:26-169(+)
MGGLDQQQLQQLLLRFPGLQQQIQQYPQMKQQFIQQAWQALQANPAV